MPLLRTRKWVGLLACSGLFISAPAYAEGADDPSDLVDTRPSPRVEFQIVQDEIRALSVKMKTLTNDYTNVKLFKGDF